jgi:hypothetical protein
VAAIAIFESDGERSPNAVAIDFVGVARGTGSQVAGIAVVTITRTRNFFEAPIRRADFHRWPVAAFVLIDLDHVADQGDVFGLAHTAAGTARESDSALAVAFDGVAAAAHEEQISSGSNCQMPSS